MYFRKIENARAFFVWMLDLESDGSLGLLARMSLISACVDCRLSALSARVSTRPAYLHSLSVHVEGEGIAYGGTLQLFGA